MSNIVKKARENIEGGVQLETSKIHFLLFADDLVLQ